MRTGATDPSRNVAAALERAGDDAARRYRPVPPDGRPRGPLVAVGDPQAALSRFLAILDRNTLLGPDGRLLPEVRLLSMGDHFDWGGRGEREIAAEDGRALLSWLAAHPPDQVTLLLGNHDLGRVGELARVPDDTAFAALQAEADRVYWEKVTPEEAFLERYPELPTAEVAARDFASFRVAQRSLVTDLLTTRRFRAATGEGGVLFCHAAVTADELAALELGPHEPAESVGDRLNEVLDQTVGEWRGQGPFAIEGLHRPGDSAYGEGRGIFYHRPGNPAFEEKSLYAGPPRRRFDPRRLPPGLLQAIGHIRDEKCRKLLKGWHDGGAAADGPLRSLTTDGQEVRYRRGLPGRLGRREAGLIFLDSGMHFLSDPGAYQLLELTRLSGLVRRVRGE